MAVLTAPSPHKIFVDGVGQSKQILARDTAGQRIGKWGINPIEGGYVPIAGKPERGFFSLLGANIDGDTAPAIVLIHELQTQKKGSCVDGPVFARGF